MDVRYVACFVVRVGSRNRKLWVREEHTPNKAEYAYRFTSEQLARDYADSIAPSMCEIHIRKVAANVNNIQTIA